MAFFRDQAQPTRRSYVRTKAAFLKAHDNGSPLVHAFILAFVALCAVQNARSRQDAATRAAARQDQPSASGRKEEGAARLSRH